MINDYQWHKGTLKRPDRVLELKQRCIDRRHRQSVDNGNSTILNGQENPTTNSLLYASNYQPAVATIDFIGKEDIPIPLGFQPIKFKDITKII